MRLGDLDITPISDGEAKLPSLYFANADWGPHQALLDADGNIVVPIGCFLVRTADRTVLIDAGIGPVFNPLFRGGDLPGGLEAAGVQPEDIDLVICTHLHLDHVGWVLRDGALTFPNATVRFGSQDIEQFLNDQFSAQNTKQMIDALTEAGRLDPITDDGEVAPGISTLHAPGHTLGQRCVLLSSGDERVFLLGDAVTCPVQLEETEWEAMSDVDKGLAKRTREALWRELEGKETIAVAAHFPGLQFGRVLKGEGKRYWS